MAATGASSVKGGNFQVFQHFLARSGAHLHLNAQVSSFLVPVDRVVLKRCVRC